MREMLGILLRREGHDVVLADNGRRAIDCLNQKPFDLVVSDARMPDIDGLEVLRHAGSINPSVIAIMITAFGSPDLIKGVEQLGVTDYVEKPFNTQVLKFRIPRSSIAAGSSKRTSSSNGPCTRPTSSATSSGTAARCCRCSRWWRPWRRPAAPCS